MFAEVGWQGLKFQGKPPRAQRALAEKRLNGMNLGIRPVNCIFLCQPEAFGRGCVARRGRLALVCHFGGHAPAFDGAFGENAFALYDR